MSKWQIYKLGQLGTVVTGKTPSKNKPEDWGDAMPFITPSDYKNYRKVALESERYLSLEGVSRLSNKVLPENSVLVTCIGSDMGKVAMNKVKAITNQQINSIVPNSHVVDNNFLYYRLVEMYEILRMYGGDGTAVPIVNKGDFENIEIEIPPLPEQHAIASVLSSLDDKIDLLHRQNKTLEAMAETLFRQWFIEPSLNPSQKEGNADEGWEEVDLEYVTERITDGAHQSPPSTEAGMPMASVKDMHQWGIDYTTCRKISEIDYQKLIRDDCRPLKHDILIAKDGSYLKHIFVVPEDMDLVILSSIAIVRPNGKYHPLLLSILLKMNSTKEKLKNIVTGAVIPRIVLKDFRKFPIILPPVSLQKKALETIEPLILKCCQNIYQIRTLERLRDILLPKLLSGEVRVSL